MNNIDFFGKAIYTYYMAITSTEGCATILVSYGIDWNNWLIYEAPFGLRRIL